MSRFSHDPCYECAFAEALKEMALEGIGLAWLPESSITTELTSGSLVSCGAGAWEVELEIRLYKSAKRLSKPTELIWSAIEACQKISQDVAVQ